MPITYLWIRFGALPTRRGKDGEHYKYEITGLDIRYWSTVLSRLGKTDNQAVKCSAIPCSDYKTTKMVSAGENQLRAAIKSHLQQGTACFHFAVQKQTDPESMLIEDASVIWDEEVSPF